LTSMPSRAGRLNLIHEPHEDIISHPLEPMTILKKKLQQFHDRFISLQGDPQTIALGMAMGVFIGVTPTIPLHTALIILLGIIFKQNISAAYLGSWLISNPVTIPILYYAQYELGMHLLGIAHDKLMLADYSISSILGLGMQIYLPILFAGLVMAPFFAVPAYFVTRHFVKAIRKRQEP